MISSDSTRSIARVFALLLVASGCTNEGSTPTSVVTAPLPPATPTASSTPVSPASAGATGAAIAGAPAAIGAAGSGISVVPTAAGAPASPAAVAGSPSLPMATPAAVAGSPSLPMAGGAAGAPSQAPAAAGSGANDASDADIETCYELRAHGQATPGDKTKYAVGAGEEYTSFIFKAPWSTPVQGLRFRHLADNSAVLHHWLLYSETAPLADGDVEACELDGPTGFLCGQGTTRSLITGWAPGRGDFRLPKEVGLELPAPGSLLAVEFHYFNAAGAMAQDQSGVEVCVTSKFRPNTASISWLGTQRINIAGRMMGTASGTCNPLRAGMSANDPIRVIFSWPHMHKLGTHMKSTVTHAAGGQEMMYDGDFNFDHQLLHDTPVMLMPGDSVTTTCTYQNTTDNSVSFGQSTTQEMCYNFVYAWPAHALDNPGELGGAANTCLH